MKMLKFFSKKLPLLVIFSLLFAWQLPAVADDSSADSTVHAAVAPVNINTADAVSLANSLNGIGEKRARAIVAFREANGSFSSVEQLLEVKGIGEAVIAKNRGQIVLE